MTSSVSPINSASPFLVVSHYQDPGLECKESEDSVLVSSVAAPILISEEEYAESRAELHEIVKAKTVTVKRVLVNHNLTPEDLRKIREDHKTIKLNSSLTSLSESESEEEPVSQATAEDAQLNRNLTLACEVDAKCLNAYKRNHGGSVISSSPNPREKVEQLQSKRFPRYQGCTPYQKKMLKVHLEEIKRERDLERMKQQSKKATSFGDAEFFNRFEEPEDSIDDSRYNELDGTIDQYTERHTTKKQVHVNLGACKVTIKTK